MISELQKYLIAECIYKIVLNIIFFYIFVRKIMKLDKMGDNLQAKASIATWIKFSIIMVIIALFLLSIALSFLNKNYWLYQFSVYSLVALAFVINYTIQLYFTLQVKKSKSRYLPNIAFWAINFATELIQIIVVQELITDSKITTIIEIFLCLFNAVLLLISIIIDKDDQASNPQVFSKHILMEDVLLTSATDRSIEQSIISSFNPKIHHKLYIDFNRQFQITQNKDHQLICQFKIAVYFEETVQIINKTDVDIQRLRQQMIRSFPQQAQSVFYIPDIRLDNLMKYGAEKQRQLENLLIEITKTDEFYCPPLLEFLQIPSSVRSKLTSSKLLPLEHKFSLNSQENEESLMPFFNISSHKNHILISNPDILELLVSKPKKQVIQFHNRLIQEKYLDMEVLPEEPVDLDFIHFFDIVVNRKGLWRCFSRWFGLGLQIQEKIFNYFDVWKNGLENFQLEIVGHQKNFDIQGKIITFYLLSVSHSPPQTFILKKRFSDFFNLNREIIIFIDKHKLKAKKLPQMPPKFSPFGSKTSPTSRLSRFNHYIKEVVKIEGINHCIKLLQFLQVGREWKAEPLALIKEGIFQQSQPSFFNEINNHV